MEENNSDFGAFLAGFVIGGLVGAATALILAPQSGQEMRGQIVDKGQELRQVSNDRIQHYRELADSYSKDYLDRADSVLSDARSRVSDTSDRIQEQARIILEPGKSNNSTNDTAVSSNSEDETQS
ncbi:MAG: YtxH domain-containing protein [Ardenticatenaceae bacterium]|nr:YtxH domain-containing protein [Ardenticatenaceae bacterium]MCB8988535.1 YtxH domain-containing protein [Ardenticatenaceae bacterium]